MHFKKDKINKTIIAKTILALFFIFSYYANFHGQQGVTTIGLQVKPIIPINYFGAGPIDLIVTDTANINVSSKLGYSFGMVIRQGITKSISIETST